MDFDLKSVAAKKILLVAHRGVSGGNIPCNTIASYETALRQGADMIEIDVERSSDGELFIFHPGMEHAHLNRPDIRIEELPAEEVRKLRFVNQDDTPTQFGLNTLDEVLEQFKDRCFINCDKFWIFPKEISDKIREHGMEEQILVKTSPEKRIFSLIEEYAPDIQYMVIVSDHADEIHQELMHRKIRYMGQELLFRDETSPLCSSEYLNQLRQDHILSWANTIVYNYKDVLSAGHNDDVSVWVDPSLGWGWCAQKGFDFIQTDWLMMCRQYLIDQGLLYHS